MTQGEKNPAEAESRPRLRLEDSFNFVCHRDLACYTSCCRDVTIMLTPYDVLRMKRALGISSSEFLERYTQLVQVPGKVLPLVQLKMDEENERRCYFVRPPYGCVIYPHRPWACRMFPLDEHAEGGFVVVVGPERCHGLREGKPWKVKDWLMDQGATQSKEMDGSYESLVAHFRMQQLDVTNPKVQQMVMMALYDLDRFKEFVFGTSFFEKFKFEPDEIEAIRTDEIALLDLGYRWVRFGLLGQKTLELREEVKASSTPPPGS